jgi:flagellar basal body-associated protein FliL
MSAPPDYPPYPQAPAPPPRKGRGVLIISIVVLLLLLCGGGGAATFFVTRNSDGKGQTTAGGAVDGFLGAVYKDHDATRAATFVCATARDKAKLTKKINDITQQDAKYDSPQYSWSAPTVEQTKTDEQILSATVRLITKNEQQATEKLRFVTTKSNGWFVCEVQQVS